MNKTAFLKGYMSKISEDTVESMVARGWTPLEAQEALDIDSGKVQPGKAQLISTDGIPRASAYTKGDKSKMTPLQRKNQTVLYRGGVDALKAQRAARKAASGTEDKIVGI